MVTWLSIAALVAIVVLGWDLYRRVGPDGIAKINDRRRTSSRMVSAGELVDGSRRLPVALAVTESTLFYENSDIAASLELEWIREIEYDTILATGLDVEGRVLRLRSDSRVFEFVLRNDVVSLWYQMLPPRRAKQVTTAPAFATEAAKA
jgi:hypothetical protein